MLNINRRELIKATLAQGAMVGFAEFSLGSERRYQLPSTLQEDFPKSVCKGSQKDAEFELSVLSGKLPDDIYGHAFFMESIETLERINLAASMGVINRLDFGNSKVNYKRKKIETASVLAMDYFQGSNYEFGKRGVAYISLQLGLANFCNTNFISLGSGRLGICYDAGRPHEIDPLSLEVYSPIGRSDEWQAGLPEIFSWSTKLWPFQMVRSSAHPYFDDNTGEFFTVNFDNALSTGMGTVGSTFVDLIVWDTQSDLKKFRLIDEQGKNVSINSAVHTICVTRNHILVADSPFSLEIDQVIGLKTSRPPPSVTPIYIIKRADLTQNNSKVFARKIVLEKEWQHIVANYDDYGNEIKIVGASSPCVDYSECLRAGDKLLNGQNVRKDLYGMITAALDEGEFACIRIRVGKLDAQVLPYQDELVYNKGRSFMISLHAWRGNNGYQDEFTHTYWTSLGFSPELLTKQIYKNFENYPYRKVPLDSLPTTTVPGTLHRFNS
ncbi:MAG: carotenoid oxygenase family protein, partial [Proteobacteria bacterium]|nr:carotenoid oxygenase family protein [Pseudomonadota bacterium]